ncbi:hypothetical protein BDK51DRAFT_46032 [Blyttiomyces helicus]|uniref:Uncharacterized protein n=1 Tax=Blyttiomyces helicus TaxID=388810 RepID=A0A4P9WLX6_9FUNG|nr:hypothetical protein BDK51DRAFT_46032 [Blyttiomyces helicus]|eukprot:RKO93432.1 hypothetical protein BDK51DRAFT_46032 [Blyttiomyces helicus]
MHCGEFSPFPLLVGLGSRHPLLPSHSDLARRFEDLVLAPPPRFPRWRRSPPRKGGGGSSLERAHIQSLQRPAAGCSSPPATLGSSSSVDQTLQHDFGRRVVLRQQCNDPSHVGRLCNFSSPFAGTGGSSFGRGIGTLCLQAACADFPSFSFLVIWLGPDSSQHGINHDKRERLALLALRRDQTVEEREADAPELARKVTERMERTLYLQAEVRKSQS